MKKLFRLALFLALACVVVRGMAHVWARGRILPAAQTHAEAAIVFGAGVRNGIPTPMLYDRVAAAVDLYKQGRVKTLVMSGDASMGATYGEPAVMKRAAMQMGVPERNIVLDNAGFSTYDTCYQTRHTLGASHPILITQNFHLDRALMTCALLGVNATGYSADLREYRGVWWNYLREVPATVNAVIETLITRPTPGPFQREGRMTTSNQLLANS